MKVKNKKYKSEARERRKERKRMKLLESSGSKIKAEDASSFWIPVRYRLLYKCLEDSRNTHRFSIKQMPEDVRENFIKECKEYQQYKQLQLLHLEKEMNNYVPVFTKAIQACFFLPDFLRHEVFSEDGDKLTDANLEY